MQKFKIDDIVINKANHSVNKISDVFKACNNKYAYRFVEHGTTYEEEYLELFVPVTFKYKSDVVGNGFHAFGGPINYYLSDKNGNEYQCVREEYENFIKRSQIKHTNKFNVNDEVYIICKPYTGVRGNIKNVITNGTGGYKYVITVYGRTLTFEEEYLKQIVKISSEKYQKFNVGDNVVFRDKSNNKLWCSGKVRSIIATLEPSYYVQEAPSQTIFHIFERDLKEVINQPMFDLFEKEFIDNKSLNKSEYKPKYGDVVLIDNNSYGVIIGEALGPLFLDSYYVRTSMNTYDSIISKDHLKFVK